MLGFANYHTRKTHHEAFKPRDDKLLEYIRILGNIFVFAISFLRHFPPKMRRATRKTHAQNHLYKFQLGTFQQLDVMYAVIHSNRKLFVTLK